MNEVRLSSDISKKLNSPGTFNVTLSVLETTSAATTKAVTVQWTGRDCDDVKGALCCTKMSLSNDECTSDVKLRPVSSVNATVTFGSILAYLRTRQLNTNVSSSDSPESVML